MPLAIKNAGIWKTPATGKLALLVGSAPKLYDQIKSDNPVNFWPLNDPAGVNTCDDVTGTKDTTYSGTSPHPRIGVPFSSVAQHYVVIPGGNPFRNFATAGFTIEVMFKTVNPGSIFGYQSAAALSSDGSYLNYNGYVPSIYIDTSGYLRAAMYNVGQFASPMRLNDGKYHHFMMAYRGSAIGDTHYYIDGVWQWGIAGNPSFTGLYQNYAQIGLTYSTTGGWVGHANSGWWYFDGEIAYFAVHSPYLADPSILTRPALIPNWKFVTRAAIKSGAVGSGNWVDSGYVGVPGTPATPTVYAWNYYNVHMVWTAPTGGAPVESYEVELSGVDAVPMQTQTTTATDWLWGPLNAQWQYMMRVRAKSPAGVFSPWSGYLKVQMGRAEIHTPRSEYRTRGWYNVQWNDPQGNGGWLVCPNAPNVVTTWIQFNLSLINGSNPFCGTSSRRAHYIYDNADSGDVGWKDNPWDEGFGWQSGANAWQGCYLVGNGWWVPSGWGGQGYVHLWGNETYLYSWTEVTPAIPNGYW
jgi:hypothetical protein